MSHNSSRGPPDINNMTSLKVDNLTYRTTLDDLRHTFEKYGDVGDVYIPRDRYSKESRGYAFVRFYDRRDAEDAMDRLDGSTLDGREIRIQLARYGRPTDGRRNDRGDRRRRGGRRDDYSHRRSYSRSRSRSYERRRYSKSRSRSRDYKRRHESRDESKSPRGRSYSGSRSPRD